LRVSSSQEAVDGAALARLEELAGDELGFVDEIIDLFLQRTPQQCVAIETALQRADFAAVANAAHHVKSAAAYVGAVRLSALCSLIEANAKAREPELVARAFSVFVAEFAVVQRVLAQRPR
jgi:HPt (histidine-containing phosphotransfer) domain-containing protein